MSRLVLMLVAVVVLVGGFAQALGEEAAPVAPVVASQGFGALVWAFVNSPAGITLLVTVLTVVLGKIFTAKPAWKTYASQYYPLFIQAVKYAEKQIPDDSPNASLGRLDAALKYLQTLDASLAKADPVALKQALSAVHADAESKGNL